MTPKAIGRATTFLAAFFAVSLLAAHIARAETDDTKMVAPGAYGTIVLNKKTGEGQAMPAVAFPHWWHRTQFTCKACHTDIGFPMQAGATDFNMGEIFGGNQCGKCHNGTTAFMPTECNRCHSVGQDVKENRKIADALKDLPKNSYGNKVDWVKALRDGAIKPKASLDGSGEMMVFDMDIVFPVTKFTPHPPDVLYPHKAHTEWLECSSCHTGIFNMQKGGNPEMSMMKIISGKYCGVCHGKVAFPLLDCFRCHSQPVKPPAGTEPAKEPEAAPPPATGGK